MPTDISRVALSRFSLSWITSFAPFVIHIAGIAFYLAGYFVYIAHAFKYLFASCPLFFHCAAYVFFLRRHNFDV